MVSGNKLVKGRSESLLKGINSVNDLQNQAELLLKNLCLKCKRTGCDGQEKCNLKSTDVRILECTLPKDISSQALQLVYEGIRKAAKTGDIAQLVRDQFMIRFGGFWQCLVSPGLRYSDNSSIALVTDQRYWVSVGHISVYVFKTSEEPTCWKCGKTFNIRNPGDRTCDTENHRCHLSAVLQYSQNIEKDMIEETIKWSKEVIREAKNVEDVSVSLSESFNEAKQSGWQFVIALDSCSHTMIEATSALGLKVGRVVLYVYRTLKECEESNQAQNVCVVNSTAPEWVTAIVLNLTAEALTEHQGKLGVSDLTKALSDSVRSKFGSGWLCFCSLGGECGITIPDGYQQIQIRSGDKCILFMKLNTEDEEETKL